jgi:hypothetical protein
MMRSHDDRIHPHPALRAGLSLPGRGVSLALRREQVAASCRFAQPSRPLSTPSGAERVRVRWGPNYRTAMHRVAPTRRAYSRVRGANEHGTAADLPDVGAGSEPAPTTPHDIRGASVLMPAHVHRIIFRARRCRARMPHGNARGARAVKGGTDRSTRPPRSISPKQTGRHRRTIKTECSLFESKRRLTRGVICRVELHWYEAHGIGRRKFKIKRFLE